MSYKLTKNPPIWSWPQGGPDSCNRISLDSCKKKKKIGINLLLNKSQIPMVDVILVHKIALPKSFKFIVYN